MTMKHEVTGFEHLHLHSDNSLLDGFGMVHEYAQRATEINQRFLCVTDHGMQGAVPEQIRECERHGITPLFGAELYVNPMQPDQDVTSASEMYKLFEKDEDKKAFRKSYHLLAIAYNEIGYANLVRMTSWGWTKGFYNRPRVNHDIINAHKEGIIFTSCCYNSEIGQAFDRGGEEAGRAMLEKYIAMFGKHFYLEMMLLDFNKQKPYNAFILKMHDIYHIPLIITQDCHYCKQEDSHMQRLMLMTGSRKTIHDMQNAIDSGNTEGFFELQDCNLWMKSEDEINAKWESDFSDIIDYELFKEAKRNTVRICEIAKGVKLDRTFKLPQLEDADSKLLDAIKRGVKIRSTPSRGEYFDRIKEEYELICSKGFSSYFLIQKMMTDEARRKCPEILGWGDGSEAVGPGRGSAVGSLVCYLLQITDVDPIREDLLFSRFLSPARGGREIKFRFGIDPIPHAA